MAMAEVEDWVSKGQTALGNDDLVEAERCFEMALKRDPLNVAVHNKLSIVHWKLGNLEDSLSHLTQALEWAPNDRDVIIHCCNVFRALGRSEDAKEIANAYVERNPWDDELRQQIEDLLSPAPAQEVPFDLARLFNEQGEQQFEKGKVDNARACFEIALEHNPDYAKAYSNLGVLSWQSGDPGAALDYLRKALQLDSQDLDILYNSAKVLASAGEPETASGLLRVYLQNNPTDEAGWLDYDALLRETGAPQWKPYGLPAEVADIYTRMGEELAKAKDILGAGQAFQRALQVDPNQVEPYLKLGRLHMDLGQEFEALALLKQALQLHPKHKETLIAAGRLLVSQGKLDEAKELCEVYSSNNHDADAVLQELLHPSLPHHDDQEVTGKRVKSKGRS